jgi:aldehyde dehydrogenase (NAD+)
LSASAEAPVPASAEAPVPASAEAPVPASAAQSIFIDGAFSAAASGQTLPVVEPSTGAVFGRIAAGDERDIDRAVRSARGAYEGAWGALAAVDRGRLMSRLAARILEHSERLAQLEARDTGKPIRQARNDIVVAARYFEFYAGAADKIHGDTIPFTPGYAVSALRVPLGVTAHIIPWNYPAQMFGRTLAPALAVGNATVIKPAEDACLTTIEFCRLAAEVGFPAGAINLVTGLGERAGAALSSHPDIDLVTFTGSPEVGRLIQRAAAEHFVPCVLELGGKSPQIVFADADLDAAIPVIVNAIVQNAGQTCTAGSRLLVDATVYDRVVTAVGAALAKLRVGPPLSDPDVGSLVSAKQRDRVRGFIDRATAAQIPLVAAATLPPDLPAGGAFVAPAVFGPVPETAELHREEVFGPVLAALPFRDEADAIRLANATDFGLVAGLWTQNGARQERVSRAVRAGQVFINCYGAGGGVELPFGGSKKSGHGREKGLAALDEFSTLKTVTNKYA